MSDLGQVPAVSLTVMLGVLLAFCFILLHAKDHSDPYRLFILLFNQHHLRFVRCETCTPMTTLPTRTNLFLLVRLIVLSQPITTDTIATVIITTILSTPPNVVSISTRPHHCYPPWNALLPTHAPSNASSLRPTPITSILIFCG